MITIGRTTVYLARGAIRKQFLCVERFHRGRFYSESGLRRLLFLVKMLLSGQYPQQRGSLPTQKTVHAQDNNTYVVDSSAEDDIDTEVS